MIDWNELNAVEFEKIHKISKRAAKKYRAKYGEDLQSCAMDIGAAHLVNKLRLDDLMSADDFNFYHDVFGIANNLNRETGEIENFFLPRFSA